ncbi:MAG: DUF481 domain-containing protein [Verrucomicrobiales bacterium]|nr:DUF481 domain-containing protein [Verrucomicrobiales bacterium]
MNTQHALCSLLCLAFAPAFAGTVSIPSGKAPGGKAPAPASPASPWNVSAAAGFNLAQGNSDILGVGAQFLASYLTDLDEFNLGVDYFYSETDGAQNTNNLHAFTNYSRTLTGNLYGIVGLDFRRDEISDLDYRFSILPALGYNLIKNDTTRLAVEFGPAYIFEKQGGLKEDYFALSFGQKFIHTFANGVKFVESVSYVPEAEDFSNYNLVAEAGLEFPFASHWALKTAVRNVYDSTPASGADENDLSVIAALSYSAQGFAPPEPGVRKSHFTKRAKAAVPGNGWTNVGGIGFGMNKGNSDNLLLTASYDSAYRSPEHEVFGFLGGAYGETDSHVTTQNIRANSQYNRMFSRYCYAGGGSSFEYDDVARVDYRFIPGAFVGVYLVNNETAKLSLDAGPAYVWEKVGGITDDYFAVRIGERLNLALSESVAIGQTAAFVTEAADWDNHTLVASLYLDIYFADNFAFRTSVTDTYDSTPAAGADSNDVTVSAGIAVQF